MKQLQLPISQPPSREVFWKKIFKKAMKPWNKPYDHKKVRLPVYISEKIDGIRCTLHGEGKPRTYDKKLIPNNYIRNTIEKSFLPAGLDGEIVTLRIDRSRKTFHGIQSDVMTTDGEPDFEYHVFDYINETTYKLPYIDRLGLLAQVLALYGELKWLESVEQYMVHDADYYNLLIEEFSKETYEGCIIRSIQGKYKFGRSTFNEQYLLRHTLWLRAEAIIVGTEEEMINDDTRSYEKSNLRPANSLGALLVKWEGCQKTFRIGSGFTREERNTLWDTRTSIVGKKATFKYKPYGTKDVPRTPIFVGIRLE